MKTMMISASLLALIAAPAMAHDPAKGEHKETRITIIETDGARDGKKLRIHGVDRNHHLVTTECTGEKTEIEEETDGKKTRMLLCGNGDKAAQVERLEKARADFAGRDGPSDAHKAKVLAALDRAIAKTREGK
jgi:hypothetical protein